MTAPHSSTRRIFLVALVLLLLPVLASAEGVITYIEGRVTIVRDGASFVADIGSEVQERDTVTTGPRATAVIRLAGAADIKLRENSSVDLSTIGNSVNVDLKRGGVFARVFGQILGGFAVVADTVVGGVRGTEFFVAYGRTIEDLPDVWLCVNSGVVEVTVLPTQATMPVREGEGVNILAGLRLTDARRYRWTERLNWNMDPAEGPVFDDTDLDGAYADLLNQDYD